MKRKIDVAVASIGDEVVLLDGKGNIERIEFDRKVMEYYYKKEDMYFSNITAFVRYKYPEIDVSEVKILT